MSDHDVHHMIEENGCPGTGLVGATLERIMDLHDIEGTCWACALQGDNKIVS